MRYFILAIIIIITSCQSPKAIFNIAVGDKKAPSNVTFDNQSLHATHYFWNFGDGNTSDEVNPSHKYVLSGRYTVNMQAINKHKVSTSSKEIIIDPPHHCMVEIQTTVGSMIAILYDDTPIHRDNFIKLTEDGYYDGMLFHRVIKGFMAQSGDPDSKKATFGKEIGGGGPNYTLKAEIIDTLVHVKGALAAARLSDHVNPKKESSGSQFYIVHGKSTTEEQLENYELQKNIKYHPKDREILFRDGGAPQLDMEYTVFGKVVEGLEVIDSIANHATDKKDRPIQDIKIISIKVIK
jgi:peptidyl-prolyl cis-trans isomerase B (cyclophilin B)